MFIWLHDSADWGSNSPEGWIVTKNTHDISSIRHSISRRADFLSSFLRVVVRVSFLFFFKWRSFINCLGSYLYDSFRLLVVWPTSYLLFPARSKTLKSKPSDHHSLANVLLVRTDFRALISLSSCVHLVSGSNNFKDITWYFRCFQQAGQSWYSVLHIPRNDIPIRLFKGFIYYTSITKFKVKLGSQAPYINLEYNSLQYVYLALLQQKIWECCTTCA